MFLKTTMSLITSFSKSESKTLSIKAFQKSTAVYIKNYVRHRMFFCLLIWNTDLHRNFRKSNNVVLVSFMYSAILSLHSVSHWLMVYPSFCTSALFMDSLPLFYPVSLQENGCIVVLRIRILIFSNPNPVSYKSGLRILL